MARNSAFYLDHLYITQGKLRAYTGDHVTRGLRGIRDYYTGFHIQREYTDTVDTVHISAR